MGKIRTMRRREWEQAQRRFEKHRRKNLLAEFGPNQYAIVLDNLKESFNVGKIFRSADAFGAGAVHLVGIDFFDPAPAKGSFKWVPAVFHSDFADCHSSLVKEGYTIFVLDPEEGEDLHKTALPLKSAFVFGHEEFGISFSKSHFPGIRSLKIPQFGKVQSLNVSVAASIVMYEYLRQNQMLTEELNALGEVRRNG